MNHKRNYKRVDKIYQKIDMDTLRLLSFSERIIFLSEPDKTLMNLYVDTADCLLSISQLDILIDKIKEKKSQEKGKLELLLKLGELLEKKRKKEQKIPTGKKY